VAGDAEDVGLVLDADRVAQRVALSHGRRRGRNLEVEPVQGAIDRSLVCTCAGRPHQSNQQHTE
jgi:hypothetical protein